MRTACLLKYLRETWRWASLNCLECLLVGVVPGYSPLLLFQHLLVLQLSLQLVVFLLDAPFLCLGTFQLVVVLEMQSMDSWSSRGSWRVPPRELCVVRSVRTVPNNEDCMPVPNIWSLLVAENPLISKTIQDHFLASVWYGTILNLGSLKLPGEVFTWDIAFLGFSYLPFFDVSYRR